MMMRCPMDLKNILSKECGVASLTGIIILSMLSFLGLAAYAITKHEIEITNEYMNSSELTMEAQNGIIKANAMINNDENLKANILSNTKVRTITQSNDDSISCSVYSRVKGGYVILLSVAERGDYKARAVAYLKQDADNRYVIKYWEH